MSAALTQADSRRKSGRMVELKGSNALRTNSSMNRVPGNQVDSFPEATRRCHEKTRLHFEGNELIGGNLLHPATMLIWLGSTASYGS